MEGFSILIPTWNNLEYLKICVDSIKKHSAYNHQIIVHVNDGSDGTLEWVKTNSIDFTHSPENIGVSLAMNMMRTKVKRDYIYFLNDDMYVLPNWDITLMEEIEKLPNNMFYLSSTMIQPHAIDDVGIHQNYGDSISTFQEKELLSDYQNNKLVYQDWLGSTRPPSLVHRDTWDIIGGYSIEYSPGMYSDPDFTAKLLFAGVRHFKGIGSSLAYHFETKTTTRIKRNNGRLQFLLKWGISNSTMRDYITRQGQPWSQKEEPLDWGKISNKRRFARLKAVWQLLCKGFGIAKDLTELENIGKQ